MYIQKRNRNNKRKDNTLRLSYIYSLTKKWVQRVAVTVTHKFDSCATYKIIECLTNKKRSKNDRREAQHHMINKPHTKVGAIQSKATIAKALGFSSNYFFANKVHANMQLLSRLEKVGYCRRQKVLTPCEVKIICEYYGYPITDEELYGEE